MCANALNNTLVACLIPGEHTYYAPGVQGAGNDFGGPLSDGRGTATTRATNIPKNTVKKEAEDLPGFGDLGLTGLSCGLISYYEARIILSFLAQLRLSFDLDRMVLIRSLVIVHSSCKWMVQSSQT